MEEYHMEVLSNPIAFVRLTGSDQLLTVRVDRIVLMEPHPRMVYTTIWIDAGAGHGYSVKRLVHEDMDTILQKINEALNPVIETTDVVHGRSWARDWGKE